MNNIMNDSEDDSEHCGETDHRTVNYKTGERFTIIALIANILLASLKVFAGIVGKSHAMLADGIHSAADSFSTGMVHAAIVISQKPKNEKYHYGYGKIESIASALVGMILIGIGGYLIYSSVANVAEGELMEPSYIALVMAIVSIVSKEALFRYGMWLGNKLNSDAITAICWDFRSDVYSSVGALVGIGGAMIGNLYNVYFLRVLDSVAGIVVGILILYVSTIVIKKAYKGLMDYAPDVETLDVIDDIVRKSDQVNEVKNIMARYSGSKMYVDICVKMKPTLSIRDAYRIEKRIENKIKNKIQSDLVITIDLEPNE